jgi:hypothetical protein
VTAWQTVWPQTNTPAGQIRAWCSTSPSAGDRRPGCLFPAAAGFRDAELPAVRVSGYTAARASRDFIRAACAQGLALPSLLDVVWSLPLRPASPDQAATPGPGVPGDAGHDLR